VLWAADSGRNRRAHILELRRRGLLLLTGSLKPLTQLCGDGFHSGGDFGGSLDEVVDLSRLLHRFAADRDSGIVDLRRDRSGQSIDLGEYRKKINVVFEALGAEAWGQDRRVRLRCR
jgi:hypothetical protein